jgi:hypothetical protein
MKKLWVLWIFGALAPLTSEAGWAPQVVCEFGYREGDRFGKAVFDLETKKVKSFIRGPESGHWSSYDESVAENAPMFGKPSHDASMKKTVLASGDEEIEVRVDWDPEKLMSSLRIRITVRIGTDFAVFEETGCGSRVEVDSDAADAFGIHSFVCELGAGA